MLSRDLIKLEREEPVVHATRNFNPKQGRTRGKVALLRNFLPGALPPSHLFLLPLPAPHFALHRSPPLEICFLCRAIPTSPPLRPSFCFIATYSPRAYIFPPFSFFSTPNAAPTGISYNERYKFSPARKTEENLEVEKRLGARGRREGTKRR